VKKNWWLGRERERERMTPSNKCVVGERTKFTWFENVDGPAMFYLWAQRSRTELKCNICKLILIYKIDYIKKIIRKLKIKRIRIKVKKSTTKNVKL